MQPLKPFDEYTDGQIQMGAQYYSFVVGVIGDELAGEGELQVWNLPDEIGGGQVGLI